MAAAKSHQVPDWLIANFVFARHPLHHVHNESTNTTATMSTWISIFFVCVHGLQLTFLLGFFTRKAKMQHNDDDAVAVFFVALAALHFLIFFDKCAKKTHRKSSKCRVNLMVPDMYTHRHMYIYIYLNSTCRHTLVYLSIWSDLI